MLQEFDFERGNSLAISPDGSRLAIERSGDVSLVQVKSWREVGRFYGSDVTFSPDSRTLAGVGAAKSGFPVFLWDVATCKPLQRWDGLKEKITCVRYSPDGKLLAIGSEDKTVRILNAQTGKELAKLDGHTGPVWSVAFSPGGQMLASGSSDCTVLLWDLRNLDKISL